MQNIESQKGLFRPRVLDCNGGDRRDDASDVSDTLCEGRLEGVSEGDSDGVVGRESERRAIPKNGTFIRSQIHLSSSSCKSAMVLFDVDCAFASLSERVIQSLALKTRFR